MIRTAVFGAGQAGRMAARWLPASHELICYIDNDENKQGTRIGAIPVVSLGQALALKPDRIWIATLNVEAAASIETQVRDAGSEGTLRYAHAVRDAQDPRLAVIRQIAEEIRRRELPGSIAELGVFRGELAAELNRLFQERELLLFDTFEGFAGSDLEKEAAVTGGRKVWHPDFSATSVELVRERLPHPERALFVKGCFPDSLTQLREDRQYVLVSLDPDLYEPTLQGLRYFWPRLVKGGTIVIHDYNSLQFPGVRAAVQAYCDEYGLMPVPLPDLHGSAVLVKP